jgi:hypothetical protein
VILGALQNAPNVNAIRYVLLTSPAVDRTSLEKGNEFDKVLRSARGIDVAYNTKDQVLNLAYRLSEFSVALGLNGFPNVAAVPGYNRNTKNITHNDFTKDFDAAGGHSGVYNQGGNSPFWTLYAPWYSGCK